jgi:hypothetical protein
MGQPPLDYASRWIGALDLKRSPRHDKTYFLDEDLGYRSDDLKLTVMVRAGFETDGASVPGLLRWVASPFAGEHAAPAVIHDALYGSQWLDRKTADDIFLEAMRYNGTTYLRRYAMYWGVRSGGWAAWNGKSSAKVRRCRDFVSVRRG